MDPRGLGFTTWYLQISALRLAPLATADVQVGNKLEVLNHQEKM